MAILLNIDTALENASVCLTYDEKIAQILSNSNQKDHASWLHTAIRQIAESQRIALTDLDAIAVSIGPGSYTGLRVGLSAAKGLCYALGKPLISVSTLAMIACAAEKKNADLVCAVIDARRMEIFTATFDTHLREISAPSAMIVGPNSFMTILQSNRVLFAGNAVNKLQKHIVHPNAIFNNVNADARHMSLISLEKYMAKKFEDLAYSEPFYLKEFYSGTGKQRE